MTDKDVAALVERDADPVKPAGQRSGRDELGRFSKGNRHGNPYAAAQQRWRGMFAKAVGDRQLRRITRVLLRCAYDAQPWAVQEVLNRCLGKPTSELDINVGGNVALTAIRATADQLTEEEVQRRLAERWGRRLDGEGWTRVPTFEGGEVSSREMGTQQQLPSPVTSPAVGSVTSVIDAPSPSAEAIVSGSSPSEPSSEIVDGAVVGGVVESGDG